MKRHRAGLDRSRREADAVDGHGVADSRARRRLGSMYEEVQPAADVIASTTTPSSRTIPVNTV
jgi:hypothetical protein